MADGGQTKATFSRQNWLDTLSYDEKPFKQALADLGLSQDAIDRDLQAYLNARAPLALPAVDPTIRFKSPDDWERIATRVHRERHDSFLEAIKDLLARREYRVEASTLFELKIPLFWLTCPATEHTTVLYQEEMSQQLQATWTLQVFGTGMGANSWVSVSYSSEVEARTGDHKVVFIVVPLQVDLINVYEKGVLVGKGLRSELSKDHQSDNFTFGISSDNGGENEAARRKADLIEYPFQLSGDTTSAIHTFSRTLEANSDFDFDAGLKVFDLSLSSKTKISRRNKVRLTFKLPAGFDYVLKLDSKGTGIWWG